MIKNPKPSAMRAEVMERINSGSLRMKPRIYFALLWLLGVMAGAMASFTFAYIISILFYMIRIQTASTPAYGARQNLSQVIAGFPWWAVALSVALVALALWLLSSYGRLYRYKISSIIIVFVLISMFLGVVLSFYNIGHNRFENRHPDGRSGRGYRIHN